MAGEINDWSIRQLPILEELKEWLLRLSVVKPQAEAAKDLIMIESVAEIRTALEERYTKRYEDIAQDQVTRFLEEAAQDSFWSNEAIYKYICIFLHFFRLSNRAFGLVPRPVL